jgi:PTH1 family peptidyl-tRNA hydrolase
LGNPGKKFQKTRHNLGFRVLEEFLKENNFPKFKLSKKFKAEISEGEIFGKKIILAKPQTFMNESGKAVKLLTKTYLPATRLRSRRWQAGNLKPKTLFVIHDDIDLPLGEIKISIGRGSAGHKGVQSIIDELGTKNFVRFRVGIMNYELGIKKIEKFVLEKFTKTEEKIVKKLIKKTVEAIEFALKEGIEKTMQKFNK